MMIRIRAMNADRLDWIFESDPDETLEQRYDVWASTYDADNDAWGWRGPDLVGDAADRHLGASAASSPTIIDAASRTGMPRIAYPTAGWTGGLVGLDLSRGMLDRADESQAYDQLVRCSLYDVPLAAGAADAVVSSGVFTHGHVGGEAFAELCRFTKRDGIVSVTQRLDLADDMSSFVDALAEGGFWTELERTEPEQLHPDRNDTAQRIITWQVS